MNSLKQSVVMVWLCVLGAIISVQQSDASELSIEAHTLITDTGTEVEAEWGEFSVPLYHDDPSRGSITLSFIRFPSTSDEPGEPLVYLAGGPGGVGSNFAAGRRHPLFMALREVGDVIAFNQRGTGPTSTLPDCQYPQNYEGGIVATYEVFIEYYHQMALYCNEVWADLGAEIGAYNTWESAGDLEALRQVLGAQKLNLWGISYGTHLALAALKRDPSSYERVVLVSPEGLEQTVKMPEYSDRYFERVQAMIDSDPALSPVYGGFLSTLRSVMDDLRQNPVTVTINSNQGEPIEMTFDEFPVQALISFAFVSDPQNLGPLLQLTAAMGQGVYEPIAGIIYNNFIGPSLAGDLTLDGMPTAMDAASGISASRLAEFNAQAENALIGRAQNYPFPALFDSVDVPDLGESFRSPFETDVPTLVFTGTLDGRTFPEAHAEVMSNFSNVEQVTVINGGHNLFMIDPRVSEIIVDFFKGNGVQTSEITVPAPAFN